MACKAAIIAVLVAANGDTDVSATQASLGKGFKLSVDQEAVIAGERLRLGFESVASDSRCPKQLTCIWEGDAEVRIWVEKAASPRAKYALHTHISPRAVTYQGYTVRLESLTPYPVAAATIGPGSYVATLVVTRRPIDREAIEIKEEGPDSLRAFR